MSGKVVDWSEQDDDEENNDDLRRELGVDKKEVESPAVASLASRISGLSTDATPFTPSQTAPSPKPKPTNALFGRALAGVKADRAPPPSSPAPSAPSAPAPTETTSKQADTMPKDQVIDDGWGNTTVQGDTLKNEDEGAFDERMSSDAASGLISNTFEIEVKLADLQADPNSPLYSVKTFEQLPIHEDLLKGIYAVGFTKPSKIQEKALPLLLNNPPSNLVGQSQSGTGKTAAFTLNMLSRVDPALMTPQAICLAPSRELARQIQEVVDKIGQFTSIKTFLAVPNSWTRGVAIQAHILIGTPGSVLDMLSRGRSFKPDMVRVFVLDEADEMIAMQGLGDATRRIKRQMPAGVQNVLFSATFPDRVQEFANEFAPEANQIFLKQEELSVEAIKQLYLECDGEDQKYDALSALYDSMAIGQSIVFCKRKATADHIAKRLTEEGHQVASLHGEKTSKERDDTLDGFRDGNTKVLITTNVIARGIDIKQVNMVVNYDVPDLGPEGGWRPDVETYLHRIGRTGRFGRKGCSVIFTHDSRSKDDVEFIEQSLGKKMKKIDAKSPEDLEQLEKALKIAMKDPKA
ncbi:ATP-dependent RNA helicase DDX19/DBP5, partial [Tremellales sp. Uapishka_1]